MADLYRIEQGENEHPKLYLQCFIDLVHQIHDVEPTTTANLFVKSLQVGSLLHENLTMIPPYDMADIQARAEGVFRDFEYREHAQKKTSLISTPPPNNPSPPSKGDDKSKRHESEPSKGEKRPRTSRDPPRFSSFEYTIPQEVIYEENKEWPIWREPYKITTPPERRDKNRFCIFHKDHRHTIYEYHNLHNQIQALMRNRRLTQYIKGSDRTGILQPNITLTPTPTITPTSTNVASSSSQEPLKQVPMIHRIVETTMEQEQKTKYHRRMEEERYYPVASITFIEEDLWEVHLPNDDPLVIKLQVDCCQLGRVLVNGGSGVDVLFWEAFQKMGFEENQIRPTIAPILGFNSQRVYPKGAIRLNVIAAECNLEVDFLIIDYITSDNAIMGQNWIHRMQGVVSTFHQVMRCQSPNGNYTIDIKGCRGRQRSAT
ncbi:uncharacterized protein LOC133784968 [Humulus lupulus]|uniref:uncharacterized protein LOC133784968 n=1 Tax=Humulus lupulus TaxID=3486 RepID=UPI002B40A857|nr:uncharacterized protein LOC133784968 [Humulus lupulus]